MYLIYSLKHCFIKNFKCRIRRGDEEGDCMSMKNNRYEQGSTLLMVIIFTMTLILLGLAAMRLTADDIKITGKFKDNTQALNIAEAGLERAKATVVALPYDSIIKGVFVSPIDSTFKFDSTIAYGGGTYRTSIEIMDSATNSSNLGVNLDLCTILPNGNIRMDKAVDITVHVLGSGYTWSYAANNDSDIIGDPVIPVTAGVSLDGGVSYSWMFNQQPVTPSGGESELLSNVTEGTEISFHFHAEFFDTVWQMPYVGNKFSNVDLSNFVILRNGDAVPSSISLGQVDVAEFLDPVISDGKITVGASDLIILVEGYFTPIHTPDYQDLVLLVKMKDLSAQAAENFGRYKVTSVGETSQGGKRKVEQVFTLNRGGSSKNLIAAIMSNSHCTFGGKIIVDGRSHSWNGQLRDWEAGVFAVRNQYSNFRTSSYVKFGGTTDNGYNLKPTNSSYTLSLYPVAESNSTTWPAYDTPEEVLDIVQPDYLKEIAKKGTGGSQYVTDPAELKYPLQAVTYVDLPSDYNSRTWYDINFGENSSGILVVHNDDGNALMSWLHTGTFKGVIIADNLRYIYSKVYGAIVILSDDGTQVQTSYGEVKYSKPAIDSALTFVKSTLKPQSWVEHF